MKSTVTIRLPQKLQEELDIMAKAEKMSKSEIIREAIARYLAVKKFQQLRKKGAAFC